MGSDDLQRAQCQARKYQKVYRAIPTRECKWRRGGNMVRVKLIDLEATLPAKVDFTKIGDFKVVCRGSDGWRELAHHIDYGNGSGRWQPGGKADANTLLCFHAPRNATPAKEWPGAKKYDGRIDLTLWDSRAQARLEGIRVYYRRSTGRSALKKTRLRLAKDATGYAVELDGQKLLHFDRAMAYQIDLACPPNGRRNMVPTGRTWRWLPTETVGELAGNPADRVKFTPQITAGPVIVVAVEGESTAGKMSATLRIFEQNGALVLEFTDYRAWRRRPELPPEQHKRSYAGQYASPYPGVHYAAFMLEATGPGAVVRDYLHKYEKIPVKESLELVYDGDRKQRGWNWLALEDGGMVAGITAHGRSHYPDHPFKAGRVDGRTTIALEPFGSEVGGHYESNDRYMLILARTVDQVRECFDTLDTFPPLVKVPLRRDLAFLNTYECIRRWVNLNVDHLMKDGRYRYAVTTGGRVVKDVDTCMVGFGEMMRLYEKTGFEPLGRTAEKAARHVAKWILSKRICTRGKGIGPNGGGIYQNELIYLVLSLARVYRWNREGILQKAIDRASRWMLDQRGGDGTWGWKDYLWHAGGWDATGNPLYYWPVNSNQFATMNFRLYQLLDERKYYGRAMKIMEDYLAHLPKGSWEIVRGGGVSDTTRGVHLFAEALEAAGDDPRMDRTFWREAIERTQDRFWVEGWPLIRHLIFGEAMWPGNKAPDIFSPGFHHWHNCGSPLDIIPRIAVAAEVGVSEHLTRWAVKSLVLDLDVRFGLEEHTHMGRCTIRDTDIEPACWLDCEMLPMLYAVRRRGWIAADDFELMHYKIHQMAQRTFMALDADHGGWAAYYDAQSGESIKYLAYWEKRHSFERFKPGEPRQVVGFTIRDAFYDHSSHYWHALEQLIDDLLTVRTLEVKGGMQRLSVRDDGPGAGLTPVRAALVAKAPGAKDVSLADADDRINWHVREKRTVKIAGQEFWLLAAKRVAK